MFMEMARRSRPSVFHQRLFAVIILQCWCQTRLAWRGEANGPFPPLHEPAKRGGREKNLIHLKCAAAELGSERASVQRVPIKGTSCKINHNAIREYGHEWESARITPLTYLLAFGGFFKALFSFQSPLLTWKLNYRSDYYYYYHHYYYYVIFYLNKNTEWQSTYPCSTCL